MKENKDEFNESYEKHKKVLYQFMNFKKNKTYIYNRSMCIHPKTELKKCNYKYLPKELTFNFFKFPRSSSCKKDIINFIKSVGIYQLFILQFSVTIAEGNSGGESQKSTLEQFPETVINKAKEFWGIITKYLCEICKTIGIRDDGSTCKDPYVAIPVVLFLFLFVFGIICLICCKVNENYI
ncbi:hypothetical protein, conserved [Plasmodium vivax]|uniref:Uncharacterized protein n=1 Tax=Plasmodium vivax TaxID=5855 RepID=A0A1G4EBL6_PLAVI|nr:hypothetical protein, conserved [Plasmodium vivax]